MVRHGARCSRHADALCCGEELDPDASAVSLLRVGERVWREGEQHQNCANDRHVRFLDGAPQIVTRLRE